MKRSKRTCTLIIALSSLIFLVGCGEEPLDALFEQGNRDLVLEAKADTVPYPVCFDEEHKLNFNLFVLDEPRPWGVRASFALDEQSTSNLHIKLLPSRNVNTSDWQPYEPSTRLLQELQEMIGPGEQVSLFTWLGFSEKSRASKKYPPKLYVDLSKSTALNQIYTELTDSKPACVTVQLEYRYCGPEVLTDPQHPDHAFCASVDRRASQPMTEDYAQELLESYDD